MANNANRTPRAFETPYKPMANKAAIYLIVANIIYGLLSYVSGFDKMAILKPALNWVNVLVSFGITFYIVFHWLKKHRDEELNGEMWPGRGAAFGFWTGLLTSLALAVWAYLFYKFVATDIIDVIRSNEIQKMESGGATDEQIETSVKYIEMFTGPGAMAVFSLIFSLIFTWVAGVVAGMALQNRK